MRNGNRRLTPKQDAFCREFIKDRNATQAAVRAGYSKRTAHSIGAENLTKPLISARITALTADRIMDIDEAFASMSMIGRTSITQFLSISGDGKSLYIDPSKVMNPEYSGVIKKFKKDIKYIGGKKTVTIELELFDKLSALNHILQLYARLQKAMSSDEALKESIVQSLREGKLDPEDVRHELPDLAEQLFAEAGVAYPIAP